MFVVTRKLSTKVHLELLLVRFPVKSYAYIINIINIDISQINMTCLGYFYMQKYRTSNDLKTSLSPIKGYAEILEDSNYTVMTQEVKKYGQVILKMQYEVDDRSLSYRSTIRR